MSGGDCSSVAMRYSWCDYIASYLESQVYIFDEEMKME